MHSRLRVVVTIIEVVAGFLNLHFPVNLSCIKFQDLDLARYNGGGLRVALHGCQRVGFRHNDRGVEERKDKNLCNASDCGPFPQSVYLENTLFYSVTNSRCKSI